MAKRWHRRLVAWFRVPVLLWAAVGCAHGDPVPPLDATRAEPVQATSQTRAPEHSARFQGLMSEHFGFTAAARDAMTRGDLEGVREFLLQLAQYPYTDAVVPGAWLPRVRALQEDARMAAQTLRIEPMAEGIANFARGCGDCHHATGGALAASVVAHEAAERPDTFPERMFRHRHAAEQMWLGLVAPSRAAWNDGATSLANASVEVEVQGELPAGFESALKDVRAIGTEALLSASRIDQARTYAKLLRTCADCHRTPIERVD